MPRLRQIITNRPAQKQNKHHRRRDPKRAVQIRISLQHVQEVRPRVQRRPAPLQHAGRVDVKELRVEGQRPEEALAGARVGVRSGGYGRGEQAEAAAGGGGGGGGVLGGLGSLAPEGGGFGEVGLVELEIFLEVGVA